MKQKGIMSKKSKGKITTEQWKKDMLKFSKEEIVEALHKCNESHNKRHEREELANQLKELTGWNDVYDMTFQMYDGEFIIYLSKNDVDVFVTGGNATPEEALKKTLIWIRRVNKKT